MTAVLPTLRFSREFGIVFFSEFAGFYDGLRVAVFGFLLFVICLFWAFLMACGLLFLRFFYLLLACFFAGFCFTDCFFPISCNFCCFNLL